MLRVFCSRTNLRCYSIKHATKNPVKYTDTINLPKTKFPNRLTATKRAELEASLVASTFSNVYRHQAEHNREPTFVLHDGPPYANGDLHMGHAVNKILKDVTLRQHIARGQRVHYVPGWDCHGLPIELKAMTTTATQQPHDALTIRQKSRKFALSAIERQKQEFRSWGVLANWQEDPAVKESVYLTFKPAFIANQLQMFHNFYAKGMVFRDLKPVYWSPSSGTALAEAELEYDPNFVSPSVYVRFRLTSAPESMQENSDGELYALVWTTTPWTLPSNQAICYNDALEYAVVRLLNAGDSAQATDRYLIATRLLADFTRTTQMDCEVLARVPGAALTNCRYTQPFDEASLPFLAAAHVQDTKGTGLVHTAPAHGPEDFLVSLEHKLPVKSLVSAAGLYTAEAPAFLRGQSVLRTGDELVLKHLASDVVHAATLTHAYPIDWRTKEPVIVRASEQWFINTEHLKERAAQELDKVTFYPRANASASKQALLTQVRKRPYWCISRQRVWGVPIPVFYQRSSGAVVTHEKIISHLCALVEREGNIDFWWSQTVAEILPASLLAELQLDAAELVKGNDIFDIWFDSGSTWSQALQGAQVADLYLEGYDQFTGWFQSSLLISMAARDRAPYKALFVHGFTVDEHGHKMSKSLGNVIAPQQIVQKYGVDVLRWWVASHGTQHMSIAVGDKLLQQAAETLSKIRATLRYLNGIVGARQMLTSDGATAPDCNTYLNRYLLSALHDFQGDVQRSYDAYEYNRVAAHIQNFVANQLSAVYVHLIKDRLYCGGAEDIHRVRHTLAHCYELLCQSLWPLAPFLVEESWRHYDVDSAGFHQSTPQIAAHADWRAPEVADIMAVALQAKRQLNQQCTSAANTWTLAVHIECTRPEQLRQLACLQPRLDVSLSDTELCEVLQVQSVHLSSALRQTSAVGEEQSLHISAEILEVTLCARCRRYSVPSVDCTCARCTEVLEQLPTKS